MGPAGCALKNNLLNFWKSFFIVEENILEIETPTILPQQLVADNGYLNKYSDLLIKDPATEKYASAVRVIENHMITLINSAGNTPAQLSEYREVLHTLDGLSHRDLYWIICRYNIIVTAFFLLVPSCMLFICEVIYKRG